MPWLAVVKESLTTEIVNMNSLNLDNPEHLRALMDDCSKRWKETAAADEAKAMHMIFDACVLLMPFAECRDGDHQIE